MNAMAEEHPAVGGAGVRAARDEDLPRLLELLQQLSEQSEIPESDVRTVAEQHRIALQQFTADPRYHLFVVEDGGRIVGTLALYVLPNLSHGGRPYAIVENVVVDAGVRGGGYGRLLMRHAERIADAAGCYKISLTSNLKRAPAHAFYERIGYHNTHKGFTRYAPHDAVDD
jgi:GNAT superfamily N-acetyltransferase